MRGRSTPAFAVAQCDGSDLSPPATAPRRSPLQLRSEGTCSWATLVPSRPECGARCRWRSRKCSRQNRDVLIQRFAHVMGMDSRKLRQQAWILLDLLLTLFHRLVDGAESGINEVAIPHDVFVGPESPLGRLPCHVLNQLRLAADHFILIRAVRSMVRSA